MKHMLLQLISCLAFDNETILKKTYDAHMQIAKELEAKELPKNRFFNCQSSGVLFCPRSNPPTEETLWGALLKVDNILFVIFSPDQGSDPDLNPFIDNYYKNAISECALYTNAPYNKQQAYQYKSRTPFVQRQNWMKLSLEDHIKATIESIDCVVFTGIGPIASGLATQFSFIFKHEYNLSKPLTIKLVAYGPQSYAFDQAGIDTAYAVLGKDNCLFVDVKNPNYTIDEDDHKKYQSLGLVQAKTNYAVDSVPDADWKRDELPDPEAVD